MKRGVAVLLAVAVTALVVGAGVGAWLWAYQPGPRLPEISVFSHGQLTRVGPYRYCDALNVIDHCQDPQTEGELKVTTHHPVQLSVPEAISRAPWQLLRVYEDADHPTSSYFRPDTKLAVTIPTLDPQRGRLTGIAVQLLTGWRDPSGEVHPVSQAEWSVRLVY